MVLILSMPKVFASSCMDNGSYTRVYANITSPLLIKPEVSIGDVISSTVTSFPSGSTSVPCKVPGPGSLIATGSGTANGNLYPTSVSGVSYRIKMTSGWTLPGFSNSYWPYTSYSTANTLVDNYYRGGTIQVDLIKTGPTPGTASWAPSILGQIQFENNGQIYNFIEIYNSTPIELVPDNPSCKVTQSAITVSLEDVNTNKLSHVGSTSRDTSFSIPLTCSSPANVSVAFSGTMADSSNAVFSNLNNGSNANQVGVQILSGAEPVPVATGSYINIGQVNGYISVPLTARYYALTSSPDAGAVNAIVYATLIYN